MKIRIDEYINTCFMTKVGAPDEELENTIYFYVFSFLRWINYNNVDTPICHDRSMTGATRVFNG
jgi:hypothetical protein